MGTEARHTALSIRLHSPPGEFSFRRHRGGRRPAVREWQHNAWRGGPGHGRLDKPAATVGGNLPTSLLTLSDKGGKTISALDAFWADAADKDYFGSLSGVLRHNLLTDWN